MTLTPSSEAGEKAENPALAMVERHMLGIKRQMAAIEMQAREAQAMNEALAAAIKARGGRPVASRGAPERSTPDSVGGVLGFDLRPSGRSVAAEPRPSSAASTASSGQGPSAPGVETLPPGAVPDEPAEKVKSPEPAPRERASLHDDRPATSSGSATTGALPAVSPREPELLFAPAPTDMTVDDVPPSPAADCAASVTDQQPTRLSMSDAPRPVQAHSARPATAPALDMAEGGMPGAPIVPLSPVPQDDKPPRQGAW